MRRREFVTLLGSTAAGWSLAAHAQQMPERMRHVGVLAAYDDPELKAFWQELEKLGWSDGRNVHIEYRYAPAGAQVQALAKELVALRPDVIFAQSRPATTALHRESRADPRSIRLRYRSNRRRLCRWPSAARWQRHRLPGLRAERHRQVAGDAQ
jgi:putative ABC transport system substrate-binding protein